MFENGLETTKECFESMHAKSVDSCLRIAFEMT